MISGLDHVTINTGRLDATRRFFTEIIGFELAPRPELDVPGIWLRPAGTSGAAIVHVIVQGGREVTQSSDRSTVDHIAFDASDFSSTRARIEAAKLPWCGNIIEDFGLWQLMVYDPNGVLIELNFKSVREDCPTPEIPTQNKFTLENFFQPAAYASL